MSRKIELKIYALAIIKIDLKEYDLKPVESDLHVSFMGIDSMFLCCYMCGLVRY